MSESRPPIAGCLHETAVPVESLNGEVIAYLCRTCDEQLPEDWTTRPNRFGEHW